MDKGWIEGRKGKGGNGCKYNIYTCNYWKYYNEEYEL